MLQHSWHDSIHTHSQTAGGLSMNKVALDSQGPSCQHSHHHHKIHKRMDKNKKKHSKSGLSSILFLSCFSSRLLLELSLRADAHFQTWGDVYFSLENSGGKLKDKLTISSVVIKMLVFSDLSAMNYFSEFSNSYCMYPVQVLGLYSVRETG